MLGGKRTLFLTFNNWIFIPLKLFVIKMCLYYKYYFVLNMPTLAGQTTHPSHVEQTVLKMKIIFHFDLLYNIYSVTKITVDQSQFPSMIVKIRSAINLCLHCWCQSGLL